MQIALAVSDPHVQHVTDADRDKRGFNFASRCSGQMRFAASGSAIEQNAAADFLAVCCVHFGVFQRIDDLEPNIFFDRFHSSDIGKACFGAFDVRLKARTFIPVGHRANPAIGHFIVVTAKIANAK